MLAQSLPWSVMGKGKTLNLISWPIFLPELCSDLWAVGQRPGGAVGKDGTCASATAALPGCVLPPLLLIQTELRFIAAAGSLRLGLVPQTWRHVKQGLPPPISWGEKNNRASSHGVYVFLLSYLSRAAHRSHYFMVAACSVNKNTSISKYKQLQNTTRSDKCPPFCNSPVTRKFPFFADNAWRSAGLSLGSWWQTRFLC